MGICVPSSSTLWEVINLEATLWRQSLIAQGLILSIILQHVLSVSFISDLLSRGLTLQSDPLTLVDQFARDNVGNYVLQSILKRLDREMLCILTFQSSKSLFTVENPERENNHETALTMVIYLPSSTYSP